MRNKLIKAILPIALIFTLCFGFSSLALAQEDSTDAGMREQLGGVGSGMGEYATTQELPQTIGSIIKIVLGFLGIVLLIVVIYGGWLWMTAGGDDEQVKKAKAWIVNGIIGLVIILLAYAITDYVVDQLMQATGVS